MAFKEFRSFMRWFFHNEEPKQLVEIAVLKAKIEVLVGDLNSQKHTFEVSLVSQKQKLDQEHQDRILDLKLKHEGRIDSIIDQYEGPKPNPHGCACHDRSCCVAGCCTRRVRYRAADGQGFCGTCFVKRNTKEFRDLKPIQPRPLRKTATVFPALETDSPERTGRPLVTKDNFSD
jgi:hypothetical protein